MSVDMIKQQRQDTDDAVKVSQMKTECKFNVPTAERGANPLPRGLAAHIFIETEARETAFMCFGVIPRLSHYILYIPRSLAYYMYSGPASG